MVYAPVQPPASNTREDTDHELLEARPGGLQRKRWVAASLIGLMAIVAVLYAAIWRGTASGSVTAGPDSLRGHVVGLNSQQDKTIEEFRTKPAKAEGAKKGAKSRIMMSSGKKKKSNPPGPPKQCSQNGKPVKFFPPMPPPKKATHYNGVRMQDVCVEGDGPYHAFIIGDWGGLIDRSKDGKLKAVSHLNHRWNETPPYQFYWPVDEDCQLRVRDQMRKLAPKSKPGYILNMGDNFYWGGVEDHCGADDITKPYNNGGTSGPYAWAYQKGHVNQFEEIFEKVYTGAHIDGVAWLGVLGNHDWGGWEMDLAWDQAVGYTWAKEKYSNDRWIDPALYYYITVNYPDFSVDYYFMDTNRWDALDWNERPPHNICGPHNKPSADCSATGGPPKRADDCKKWFIDLWEEQKVWLKKIAAPSEADWRIVVTHFPPDWGRHEWPDLAKETELDAIITGHRHSQQMHMIGDPIAKVWPEDNSDHLLNDFMDPTCWIISGGGGGITSEHSPKTDGQDDQYGFLDMTLTKEHLQFDMISHGGVMRKSMKQPHFYSHNGKAKVVKITTTTSTTTRLLDKEGHHLKVVQVLFNKETKYDTVIVYKKPSSKAKKRFIDNGTEVQIKKEKKLWRKVLFTDPKSGKKQKGWVGHQNIKEATVRVKTE